MQRTPYHRLVRSGSAPVEAITLTTAKQYLRVEHNADDALIGSLITAVRLHAETRLGVSLVEQEWQVEYLECLPSEVVLPMPPVQSISAITISTNGEDTTVEDTAYRLVGTSLLRLDTTLSADFIRITYTAGEATGHADIIQGMLMHLAACYEMRGVDVPIPAHALSLYDAHREIRL
jgi:uncharacterized phiE125 gp8 family phage protein